MIIIDIDMTVSLVFNGDYSGVTGTTTLKLVDKSNNTSENYPLTDIISGTLRYTEFSITGFTSLLEPGQYFYEFLFNGEVKDNGICKVIGDKLSLPIYINYLPEFLVYLK